MNPRRIAMLLMSVASPALMGPVSTWPALAQQVPATAGPSAEPVERILLPPPIQWDNGMLNFSPALPQTARDFANLTGGLAFGMSPAQVNALLPDPYPGLAWSDLPLANEYPGEVRYFGVTLDRAGPLRMDPVGCTGAGSYLVLLFTSNGLFRLSYRLIADKNCTDTNAAAQSIFARFVPITQAIAMSTRYRTGNANVVEVTDPTVAYMAFVRWRRVSN
ncbi:MAG TPA: hypothetical protein VH023_13535 [Rhodopila sp.]|jgi:hypothetical protein|nr:hypothetical protein [Rhodopila sp.]